MIEVFGTEISQNRAKKLVKLLKCAHKSNVFGIESSCVFCLDVLNNCDKCIIPKPDGVSTYQCLKWLERLSPTYKKHRGMLRDTRAIKLAITKVIKAIEAELNKEKSSG